MNDMISGAAPFFPPEDRADILAAIEVMLRNGILAHGPYGRAFEAACAEMAGTRHALAVSSGAAALELVWEALDLNGAEVVVPAETFVATAASVVRAGGTPVFADIDPGTLSLTPDSIARRIGPRTRAVALVHMFGLMSPDIPAIRDLCAARGLILIEDAAHAHGATLGGLRAGGLGAAGCFSYYATKVLTTGEGGIITTDDDDLAARLACLRNHGRAGDGQTVVIAGGNYRMGEIPALLGLHQQRRLADMLAHRRRIAAIYREMLAGTPRLALIDPEPRNGHAYWRYAALLDPDVDRDALQAAMAERYWARVTWMYEPLCHRQPVFAGHPDAAIRLPGADSVCGRLINLPTHPGVDEAAARRLAAGLDDLLRRHRTGGGAG